MAVAGERKAIFHDDGQMSAVLKALNEQRKTCRFCDVLLKVCGEEIYAHSNVLAAASVYFGSFLGHGSDMPRAFSQKSPQIIEIHIDGAGNDGYGGYGEAVRKVVDFMYTNQIELSDATLTQVVEIAKIMQMDNVLVFCENFQNAIKNIPLKGLPTVPVESGNLEPSDTSMQKSVKDLPESTAMVVDMLGITGEKVDAKSDHENNNSRLEHPSALTNVEIQATDQENSTSENTRKESGDENAILDDTCNDDDDDDTGNKTYGDDLEADVLSVAQSDMKLQSATRKSDPKSRRKRKTVVISRRKQGLTAVKDNVSTSVASGLRRSKRQRRGKRMHDENFTLIENLEESEVADEKPEMRNPEKRKLNNYECDQCDFKTDKMKGMSEHKREHLHSQNVCSFCYFQAENPEALKDHLSNHTGPQPYLCTVCEVSFKTKTQLNLHLPKHSTEKPFVCEICSAGFKWKHALKNHMIVHSGSKDHLCDICGFSTAHKSQLKAHKLIHTGDTFKCNHPGCTFQATKRQNLKYHMLTHTQEKPHQCYVCGQSFSLAKNMKRHMLLHDTQKPLQCKSCTFTTTRHDKLKEHARKQHGTGTPPERRHRISDYQSPPPTVKTKCATAEVDVHRTNYIQINIPAEMSEQSLIPIAFTSNPATQTQTVEYLVSSF